MDYKLRYESLLQTLCNAYSKMYQLLEGVDQCDQELGRLSRINRPGVEQVCGVTDCKDRLIIAMNQISIAIEPVHEQLDNLMALCQEISVHPLYRRMQELQFVLSYAIRKVINKEDIHNPDIISRLNDYKKSLELDKAISEVPESDKQIYMLMPEHKEL